MKKIATLIAVLLFSVGCASTGGGMGSSSAMPANYDEAVAQAKAEIKKAKSMGHEWRDSGKMLKKAEKAHKTGDKDKAIKLAMKAKKQGELGQMQAKDQKAAGPWLF
ncbi:MAG: SoxXA-binding protein [Gammaproteobacteria bacterium]|nr:SoxXA-binding protein [Gammaproteobacteria bacterium]MDH5729901.1 SoxXA-binding protein [Gammaproteobacteria bacterium]